LSEGPVITGTLRVKDETGAGFKSAETRMSGFGDVASVAGGIVSAEFSRNVVGALEDVGRSSVEQAAAFELATARIMAATGLTGGEATALQTQLEATAKTLGVEFGVGATRAMEALEALVKAGLEGEDAVGALTGVLQLSTIEGINTASAANMVVAAMTQYGLSAEEATRVVDGFVKASAAGIDTASGYASGLANVGATAANMGLSMEETLAALVQLDNTFGGAQESGTFLNRMLLDMTAKAENAGLELYNVDGSMKSLDEIMGQVRLVLKGFGDDQEAANEWLGQFDTRAQKAILGLANYDETVGETQAVLEDMSGAQDQVNVILDTYTGKMSQTKAQQELNNIAVGETTTKLSLMAAAFTANLGPIGNVASALGPSVLSGAIQGLTVTYLPQLIGKLVGGGGLTAALSGVGNIIPGIGALIGAAGPIGVAIVAIGAAVAVFALAWQNNWFGIRDRVAEAAEAVKGIVGGLEDTLSGALEGVKTWAGDVVSKAKGAWEKASAWLTKKPKKTTKEKEESTAVGPETPAPPPVYVPALPPVSMPAPSHVSMPEGPWGGAERWAQSGFEGLIRRPTRFLVGEAGPEYVSVTPQGRGRGQQLVIHGPLVQVMGSADEATARLASELIMKQLRRY